MDVGCIHIYVMDVGCRCGCCDFGSHRKPPELSRKVPIIGILIILATISHLPPYVICICQSSVVIGVGCRCGCDNSGSCRNISRTFQESSSYSSWMLATPEYYHIPEYCYHIPEHYYHLSPHLWKLQPWISLLESSRKVLIIGVGPQRPIPSNCHPTL